MSASKMRHPIVIAILAAIRLGASFVVGCFTICVITTLVRPTIFRDVATLGEIRGVSKYQCVFGCGFYVRYLF